LLLGLIDVSDEERLMDFLGMGMGEILLILVIALIIWGPGRLPDIARTLGKTARALRKATFDISTVMTKELDMEEKDHSSQPRVNSDDKTKESSGVDTMESCDTEIASPRD